MEKTFDVVALGEGMVEFNQTTAGQPGYLQGFGGDSSNAVIAAARAGATNAYLTRVGQDAFGQSLLDLWRGEGVAISGNLLARMAQGAGIFAAARYANAAAALAVQGFGAVAPLPRPDAVRALL